MIRGIDEEESSFLNDVAEKQMKIDLERMSEEKQLIREYKISFIKARLVTLLFDLVSFVIPRRN